MMTCLSLLAAVQLKVDQLPLTRVVQQLFQGFVHVVVEGGGEAAAIEPPAAAAASTTRGRRAHDLLNPPQLIGELQAQGVQVALPLLVAAGHGVQAGAEGLHVVLQAPLQGLHLAELVADLRELVAHALALLLVPGLLLIADGGQGVHVLLQRVVRRGQAGEGALHLADVLHHLCEALKVHVGVVWWHAGVGLDGVLAEALGLQLAPLRLLWPHSLVFFPALV